MVDHLRIGTRGREDDLVHWKVCGIVLFNELLAFVGHDTALELVHRHAFFKRDLGGELNDLGIYELLSLGLGNGDTVVAIAHEIPIPKLVDRYRWKWNVVEARCVYALPSVL